MTRRARTEAPLLLLIIRGGCYPAGFSSPFRPRATHFTTTPPAPPPPVTQTHRRLIRLVGPQKLYPITLLRPLRAIQPTNPASQPSPALPSKNFPFAQSSYLPLRDDVLFFYDSLLNGEPFLRFDDLPSTTDLVEIRDS